MIELYDYQQTAYAAIKDAFKVQKEVLAVMATGLGKTYVAAFWSKNEIKKGKKGLLLCHETGILDQNLEIFRKILGNTVSLKTFYGNDKDWDADKADVLFASFGMFSRGWKKLFFEDEFDFIVIDESHHGQAPTYKAVIDYFNPQKMLAITATPDQMTGRDIREVFGDEIVNYPLEEAIANSWLSAIEYHILSDNLNHWALKRLVSDVLEKGKRISMKQLNETIFIKSRDEKVARIIRQHSGESKKVIIFCENIRHAEKFKKYLTGAETYHSNKSAEKNREILHSFREKNLQYILTVDKFNEGIDIPDAEVIVFLRCTDSKRVFFQQLGRGLRKIAGKEKVVVLDFVANCERLSFIREMTEKIKAFCNGNGLELSKELLTISGDAFNFIFTSEQVDILNVIRMINASFFKTWQEASAVVAPLKLKSRSEYLKVYKSLDHRLPSDPGEMYDNFPGWTVFLGRNKIGLYETWEEASKVVIRAGIETLEDYHERYKNVDPRLPSRPYDKYDDYPGWRVFVGKEKKVIFGTWQEASEVVIDAKVLTVNEYFERYKEISPRLPRFPNQIYDDFPGWNEFLGAGLRFYASWQDASKAAIALDFESPASYKRNYKKDPLLPRFPESYYKDFPGWESFLGREDWLLYKTWQEASAIAIAAKIPNKSKYRTGCKKIDGRLPIDPEKLYDNFPGWNVFLNLESIYENWMEASKAVIKLKIRNGREYRRKRNADPRLPGSPDYFYEDFPGWSVFLGRRSEVPYATWQEASCAIQEMKLEITSSTIYRLHYKKDPRLPSQPQQSYKDFPGWKIFLGDSYGKTKRKKRRKKL